MTIKVGESNEFFQYNTGIDISSFTSLSLKFTSPSGIESTVTEARITVPAVNDGDLLANEYMQFTVVDTDFVENGFWMVCGVRTDTTTTPDTVTTG